MLDLRTVLRLDALATGALGALLLILAGVLDGPLGLPVPLSVVSGAGLVLWAAFVAWVSVDLPVVFVGEVIVVNGLWVLGSVVFAFAGWADLTGLGLAFVLVQAGAVTLLTGLQVAGRRGARTVEPA